ncbi:MAG: hypothetical protein JO198_12875 [Candidatus Dormibacteraeota bacterium]|nr:hypothetical protein [Candidatus Dormibacteraeota bacterium]
MKKQLTLAGALTALSALAACGGSSSPAASSSGGAGSSGASTVATGSTSLGTVLTNSQGFTLYYFTPEQGSKVVCAATSACNGAWPPVTSSSGAPAAPSGVSGSFGVVTLPNGQAEVTYNGWPLHTYAGDSGAGQTNGQGIAGKWFAATPGLTASGSGSGSGSGGSTPSASSAPYGY